MPRVDTVRFTNERLQRLPRFGQGSFGCCGAGFGGLSKEAVVKYFGTGIPHCVPQLRDPIRLGIVQGGCWLDEKATGATKPMFRETVAAKATGGIVLPRIDALPGIWGGGLAVCDLHHIARPFASESLASTLAI